MLGARESILHISKVGRVAFFFRGGTRVTDGRFRRAPARVTGNPALHLQLAGECLLACVASCGLSVADNLANKVLARGGCYFAVTMSEGRQGMWARER